MLADLTRRFDRRRGACALIAIKARAHCKTRLTASLAPAARVELVRSMLSAVLTAATHAQSIRQVIVVTPERDAVPAHIPVLADSGRGLNFALTQAHRVLCELGSPEVVILPADLPTITSAEIDALVHAAHGGGFAIAPDVLGVGTNALCLVSGRPFRFQFGIDSLRLHLEEAQRSGLIPEVVRRPGLEFDVDTPADLQRLGREPWLARLA
jgi:2-phospho-L-lactate guanylyltransferase